MDQKQVSKYTAFWHINCDIKLGLNGGLIFQTEGQTHYIDI